MKALQVRPNSSWSADEINQFLQNNPIPMRISCNGDNGFPLICSVWFAVHKNTLYCISHENAKLTKQLQANNRCAFEVATNSPPYMGVRGQARATLERENAKQLMIELNDRYLEGHNSSLSNWLLSRIEHECVIKLEPTWITAWDYTERMANIPSHEVHTERPHMH